MKIGAHQRLVTDELKKFQFIKTHLYDLFLSRLKKGKLTRAQNPQDHFCAFFLPFDEETGSVYIGHHINSGLWLPPGGHIEENESPLDAVHREIIEELAVKPESFKIEPFNLTIVDIAIDKKRPCKIHYDFWYLVFSPLIKFKYAKSEFKKAGWYSINKALKKVTQATITGSLNKLQNNLNRL